MISSKRCSHCKITKPVSEFNHNRSTKDGFARTCRSCVSSLSKDRNHRLGVYNPLGSDPTVPGYLGVHVAERVLSHVFKDVERMPYGNSGYDFICNKGYKIDVKSSTHPASRPNMWMFHINKNKIADYFLCIAFNNRDDLTPEHLWLIPSGILNDMTGACISTSTLSKWKNYELLDKLDDTISCCDTIRDERFCHRTP